MQLAERLFRVYYQRFKAGLYERSIDDAEIAHDRMRNHMYLASTSRFLLKTLERISTVQDERLPFQVGSITFPGRACLAAGIDKTGEFLPVWAHLMDYRELGGFTPCAQAGDERPRIKRFLYSDGTVKALINHMAFPNPGETQGAYIIAGHKPQSGVTAVNIGKGKETPLDRAAADYASVYRTMRYIAGSRIQLYVHNPASPNTPDLRLLLTPRYFGDFLSDVMERIHTFDSRYGWEKAEIGLKLSSDMSEADLAVIVPIAWRLGIRIMIASNTTTSREGLPEGEDFRGGLSGSLLRKRSLNIVRMVHQIEPSMTIMGVGGINCTEAVYQYYAAGARLFGCLTGLYDDPLMRLIINRAYLDCIA